MLKIFPTNFKERIIKNFISLKININNKKFGKIPENIKNFPSKVNFQNEKSPSKSFIKRCGCSKPKYKRLAVNEIDRKKALKNNTVLLREKI